MLILNFLSPIISKGNANLNQNSEIGSLYESKGDSPDREECSPSEKFQCESSCYEGCVGGPKGTYECTGKRCSESQECKFVNDDLCSSFYICVFR